MKNVIERTDLIGFPRGWEAATNAQLSAVGVFPNTMFYSHRIGCMILQCLQSNKGDHFQVGVNGRAEMMRWRRSGAYPHLIVMLQSLNGEIMNFQDIKYVDDKLKDVQPHQGKLGSVKLLDYTGAGFDPGDYAARLLIYIKNTRLEQSAGRAR
jgi:hypothetical protein